MNVPSKITVAVISDPHFCKKRLPGGGSEPSHIVLERLHEKPGKNPWSDLDTLLTKEKITANYLLCPGDITTHAEQESLKVAWGELIELGEKLEVSLMACATGNHDVSSRINEIEHKNPVHDLDNPPDLFENLKLLEPEYPLLFYPKKSQACFHRQKKIHYFGADFVIHEDEFCRIVIFNSCARHLNDNKTYERGIIAKSTLVELKKQLDDFSDRKINIFLCHHHPVSHSQEGSGNYDFILGGEDLMNLLQDFGDWIVIHGHKHEGRIIYSQSNSGASAVIFSASSIGAVLTNQKLDKYRNQFYLLEIELGVKGPPLGSIKVWNWYLSKGWQEAKEMQVGLSSGVGFGERRHEDELAEKISDNIGNEVKSWEELVLQCKFIKNMTPGTLVKVLKKLEKNYKIVTESDPVSGKINKIGRGSENGGS